MSLPRHWAKILLGVAVSAALLVYLLASVDLREVGHHLARTRWDYLAVSVGLGLLAVWVRAQRWHYLFPPDASPSRLFSAVMIGYLGNNVLPLRAGEIIRGYLAARHSRQGFWTAIATLVVERVLDALAVVVILAWLVLVIPVPDELKWGALVFLSLDLAAMAVLTALVLVPERFRALVSLLIGGWPRLLAKALGILETFALGLQGIRTPAHLLPILAWSVGLWIVYALATWTALAAAQISLSLTAAWTVVAFVGLGVSLPSAPGFIGIVQGAVVLALALFDVPRAEALSFSFLYHASQFIPVTVVGWLLLMLQHASLLQLTRQAIPEADARRT